MCRNQLLACCAVGLGMVLAGGPVPLWAENAAPAAAVAPQAGADKAPELSKLKNEDLIKRALAMLERAEGEYRAQAREVATAELRLADARKELAAAKMPPAAPEKATPKSAMEAAKARKTAADQSLKLAQAQKSALDRLSAACNACQTAEVGYLNTLDDLRAYALEVDLRTQDKTMPADKAPEALKAEELAKKKSEIQSARDKRQQRVAALVKEQDAATKATEEASKAVLATEANVTQASATLAKEEKSTELKKQYAQKSPADLGSELSALAEEGIGLKGTFELGLARFNAAAAQADKLRKQVDELKPPEVKIPQLSRPEDVEQAATGTQKLIEFYTLRIKALEDLSAALAEVVRIGTEFNGDATVSSDHLFKMRVLAELVKKSGSTDVKLIPEAEPDRVLAAEQNQSKQVASVQAAVERARVDAPTVEKQLAETRTTAENAASQLARLKQSQAATLAAMAWEAKIKEMKPEEAIEAFNTTSKSLQEKLAALEKQQAEYTKALGAAEGLNKMLDGLKDPLLRAAEEAGQTEKTTILGELRKEAGLERAAAAPAPAADATPTTKPAEPAAKAAVVEKRPEPSDMEKATASLQAFQQVVSGRVRVMEERDQVGSELLTAIANLDNVDDGYGKALSEARLSAAQLYATAINLKKRIGKNEITSDKVPAELAQALRPDLQTKLDADLAALLTSESQFKQKKESLEKKDPNAEAGKAATKELLALVGQRLDLLSDLRRLDADYKLATKDRDPVSVKRLEQEAAERQSGDSSVSDTLLAIDGSKRAKMLAELLESEYREVIDLEHKENNLRVQREKAQKLVELSQREQEALAKVRPLIEKQVAATEAAREEEAVLTRARLKPDQADDLIKAFKAKTGRLLAKPVPLTEKEKSEKVAELATALFEKTIQVTAAKNWDALLTARLAPTGIKSEAGAFQDEISRLNATSGANVRRVESLTGQKPPEPGSKEAAAVTTRPVFAAIGGSIVKTHQELTGVRRRGVMTLSIKILAILIGAWMMPKLLMPLIGRAMGPSKPDEHGNSMLVMGAVRVFVKTAIWIIAIALILNVLGFDVTAIVAGLGIGGLAIGLAAQPVISDVISAVIIFAERKFAIGDVIKIGGDEPAKVVGLSWRGTQLKGSDGLIVNVPNRNITSAVIRNLTKEGRTFDTLTINITTPKDAVKVLAAIKKATKECKHVAADSGHSIAEYQHKGTTRVIKYRFWWYLRDYDVRNQTRDEVFTKISESLETEELAGTEITLA